MRVGLFVAGGAFSFGVGLVFMFVFIHAAMAALEEDHPGLVALALIFAIGSVSLGLGGLVGSIVTMAGGAS